MHFTKLVLVLTAAAFSLTGGEVLHVSTNGSDSSSRCTESAPCRTIARAALLVRPGDTVRVAPGEYNERVTIKQSGREGNWITFEGHPGTGCPGVEVRDINSRGARPTPQVKMQGFVVDADHIKIDCFEITDTGSAGVNIAKSRAFIAIEELYVHDGPSAAVDMARVELSQMPRNVTIARNYVTRTSYGFLIFCQDNCVLEYNEVERNVTSAGADLDYTRFFGEGVTLRRNYFHGNSVKDCTGCHIDCFQTWDIGKNVWEVARRIVIDGNVCFNAHQGIIARSTVSGPIEKIRDWTVVNNIFRYGPNGSSMAFCALFEHVDGILFAHNLCGGPLVAYRRGSEGRHVNNIHYLAGLKPYSVESGSVIIGERNALYNVGQAYRDFVRDVVAQDPLLINPSDDDYRLQTNSPLIDMGVDLNLQEDHSGNPRFSGRAPDIGPYEVFQDNIKPTGQQRRKR